MVYTYYNERFAAALFREAVTHHGRYWNVRQAFVRRACEAQNSLWRLLPVRFSKWAELLEDLFTSPRVIQDVNNMLAACLARSEFLHLTVDATIRCARRVKGQADYRASKAKRESALFGDKDAFRRIVCV